MTALLLFPALCSACRVATTIGSGSISSEVAKTGLEPTEWQPKARIQHSSRGWIVAEAGEHGNTHHLPLMVMTTHGLPASSTSLSTLVEKQMALMMPSPNFSFMMAL